MNDRIFFSWTRVSPEKFADLQKDFEKGIPPYHQEGLQDIRLHISAQSALSSLRQRDGDLADFLQHLDSKLNLLLREARGGRSPLDTLHPQEVSLSGGGMAFFTHEKLKVGEHLELHLILQPHHTFIYCLGEVVDCGQAGEAAEEDFRISVKFVLLMDEDHDKIVQHVFRLQGLALRHRRLRGEEESGEDAGA